VLWIGGEATVCGAGAGSEATEKSNKSIIPELAAGGLTVVGDAPGAESNAPKPLDELNVRDVVVGCMEPEFCDGFASKKPPPPKVDIGDVICGGDR